MEIAEVSAERLRRLTEAARESAAAAADDREARDLAISDAEQAKWSTNRIHRETGLSLGHVSRILLKMNIRRQRQAPPDARVSPS
jgi:hypothetical protein